MAARVDGYGGIRETYEVNPDGSVTTLRTRLGWPAFETTGAQASAAPTAQPRGFVAKVPGGRAVLFNPYTLAVFTSPYLPASNSYSVQDFGTAWNVAPADTTHWYDVVLFDGTTIKVNSKAMPSLRITANHGFPAIPYVINRDTADDQYGNAERNTTEKRVFAVGRHSVKSWGGSGVMSALQPATPRTDEKAMTIGQRFSIADNVAHLWQMYHTGAYWEGSSSEWYFSGASVQMLLASAYLVKTDISAVSAAHSPAAFGDPVSTSATVDVTREMPDAVMLLVGHAELENQAGGFAVPGGSVLVRYPWDGYTTGPVSAFENTHTTRSSYFGNATSTSSICDKTITTNCTNSAVFDDNTSYVHYPDQIVVDYSPQNYADIVIYSDGTTSPSVISHGVHGAYSYGVYAESSPSFLWSSETSEVIFSSSFVGGYLIEGRAYRRKEFGSAMNVTQYNWAEYFLENPRGGWGTGFGYNLFGQGHHLIPYNFHTENPVLFAAEAALAQSIADAFIGDETRSDLNNYYNYLALQRYSYNTTERPVQDRQEVTWNTKDYLLYDEHNGVAITIEGAFTGTDSSAALTVMLRIKTRHHDTVQTIYSLSFTYSELVHLKQIGLTGKYAIPSPQVRSIFSPLYQEQGSFKGAHYVTLAEESNGAAPFHGFNFLMYLRPYSSLNTCNADNETGQSVYFVPCNLLEMLYAFVFSSEYGVALSGERYPVTHSANFTSLMSTLFSNPIRVSVKNGVAGAWTDALGSDFASVSTVSLHRA